MIRAPQSSQVTWPVSFLELDTPSDVDPEGSFAVEPKCEHNSWLSPQIVDAVGGKIRIVNTTAEPVATRRHKHVCNAKHTEAMYEISADHVETKTMSKNESWQILKHRRA